MKQLAIIGAGGHAKVVADTAQELGWSKIHFFDDSDQAAEHLTWPIVGKVEQLFASSEHYSGICVALGNNPLRLQLCRKIIDYFGERSPLVPLIHPRAYVSSFAQIGLGTVVFAGAVINAGAKIGLGCIINTLASVDHDCQIGDGVHISPGVHLAGNVSVGNLSWVGIGACVKHNIFVGESVMVGAGAAVVHNIKDNHTVVGVPAVHKVNTIC